MAKKSETYKRNDAVVACPKALANEKKADKIQSRTGLTIDQLRDGPMKVIKTLPDDQLEIKHDRLQEPFVIHSKYISRPATSQQA